MTASKNDIHSCLVPVGLLATRWVFLKLFLETKNKYAVDWKCDIMEIIIINGNNHQLGSTTHGSQRKSPPQSSPTYETSTDPIKKSLIAHYPVWMLHHHHPTNSHTLRHPVTMPKTSVTSTSTATVAHPHLRLPTAPATGHVCLVSWLPPARIAGERDSHLQWWQR